MKRIRPFVALISLLTVVGLNAASVHAQSSSPLTVSDLKVDGLNNESEILALYLGDFSSSRIDRDDRHFFVLLRNYVDDYSTECKDHLPADKVPILIDKCIETSRSVNVYGTPVGDEFCSRSVKVESGRFAKPGLLTAVTAMAKEDEDKTLGGLFNGLKTAKQILDSETAVGSDTIELIRLNNCKSTALKRLEENLVRFARREPPLKLASGELLEDVRSTSREGSFVDSDYARLLDDLIAENSRGWALNQYHRNSVSNLEIRQRDEQGRPLEIVAHYLYSVWGNSGRSGVRLTFSEGVPDCMHFFDSAEICRSADPKIKTAYEKGAYR